MAENRIQYQEACPTCVIEGRDNKLFLDMDTVEIRCEVGHVFEELPSDTVLRSGQQKPLETGGVVATVEGTGADIPEAPGESPVNTLEESLTAEEGSERLADVATKMAEQNQQIMQPLPEGVGAQVAGPEFGLPQVARLARQDDGTVQLLVAAGAAVNLPNGDLLLGVVIPETWRTAVEAEAQAQLKSPAAYFADWLTSEEMRTAVVDLLQNYWTSAYSQTV